MRVRFEQPWDKVTRRNRRGTPMAMRSFVIGQEETLPRPMAEEAVAAGKAIEIEVPPSPNAVKPKKVANTGDGD